jgi:hypothetical protein
MISFRIDSYIHSNFGVHERRPTVPQKRRFDHLSGFTKISSPKPDLQTPIRASRCLLSDSPFSARHYLINYWKLHSPGFPSPTAIKKEFQLTVWFDCHTSFDPIPLRSNALYLYTQSLRVRSDRFSSPALVVLKTRHQRNWPSLFVTNMH